MREEIFTIREVAEMFAVMASLEPEMATDERTRELIYRAKAAGAYQTRTGDFNLSISVKKEP